MSFQPRDPNALTPRELSEVLEQADVIETWLKAVRALAEETLTAGEEVPGWCLVPKRGMRKWSDERLVKQRLASMGLTDFIKEEVVSPTQVERMCKASGITPEFSDLIVTASSGVTLARDTDRRAAASATAAKDFADKTKEKICRKS